MTPDFKRHLPPNVGMLDAQWTGQIFGRDWFSLKFGWLTQVEGSAERCHLRCMTVQAQTKISRESCKHCGRVFELTVRPAEDDLEVVGSGMSCVCGWPLKQWDEKRRMAHEFREISGPTR